MPTAPPRLSLHRVLVLVLVLAGASSLLPSVSRAASRAAAEPPDGSPPAGTLALRWSRPPAPRDVSRMERWHRRWRAESAGVRRAAGVLAAALGPVLDPSPAARLADVPRPALVPACRELTRELLALDRDRALPAPDPVVDRYLRRGLRRLSGAAMACLGDRPYAAAQDLRQARAELAAAALALRRFGLAP